jgi:pyrroloquinoline quinone (PQQ) biosynthesis protein C
MTSLRTPWLEAELAVDALADAARNHRAVCHPYLAALADGSLPNPTRALADFAHQYMGYSTHFPRYLTALISRLDDPDHRQTLLANLQEETGQYAPSELATLADCGIQAEWILGVPHPELFRRFHRAVNGADAAGAGEQLEVVCWRDMLLTVISMGSAAEAVGALGLGTEAIVPILYDHILRAIARHGGLHPRDTVFFALHTLVDDAHQASLRQIAIAHAATASGQRDLARGMHKALALRDSVWNWLHERARRMDP